MGIELPERTWESRDPKAMYATRFNGVEYIKVVKTRQDILEEKVDWIIESIEILAKKMT